MILWVGHDRYRPDFHEAAKLVGRLEGMGRGARQRSSAYVDPRDIEGCEALLEAHFTQVCSLAQEHHEGRFCHHTQGSHTGLLHTNCLLSASLPFSKIAFASNSLQVIPSSK